MRTRFTYFLFTLLFALLFTGRGYCYAQASSPQAGEAMILFAQDSQPVDSARQQPSQPRKRSMTDTATRQQTVFISDTASNFKTLEQMKESTKPPQKEFVMKKSPWSAIWRSLVLPGWGQFYNESYWKAPIFTAAAGVAVYFIIQNNKNYIKWANEYDRIKADTSAGAASSFALSNARFYREGYRDNRDMAAFYLVGIYILSAVDAYVDAHLFDFNVSDDISGSVLFSPQPALSLQIKLGK